MRKTRVFCLLLAICTAISFFGELSPSAEQGESGYTMRLSLRLTEPCEGELEIALELSSDHGICAMLSEISYDESRFLFLGCGSEQLDITYDDVGGGVRFLLDGTENSPGECILATFYFRRIAQGDGEFSLGKIGDGDCLYFNADGEISSCAVSEVEPCVAGETVSGSPGDIVFPKFISFTFSKGENDHVVLDFSVEVGESCIFAGVKVFAVDIDNGDSREYYFIGKASGGALDGRGSLGLNEKNAVVITAVGYEREGIVVGEKQARIIY